MRRVYIFRFVVTLSQSPKPPGETIYALGSVLTPLIRPQMPWYAYDFDKNKSLDIAAKMFAFALTKFKRF